MGFKYSYSADDITSAVRTINAIKYDACDIRLDGWVQWGAKQDLWQLKWVLDRALKDCPNFSSTEDEWLREQEQKQIIRILKDEV